MATATVMVVVVVVTSTLSLGEAKGAAVGPAAVGPAVERGRRRRARRPRLLAVAAHPLGVPIRSVARRRRSHDLIWPRLNAGECWRFVAGTITKFSTKFRKKKKGEE